MYENIFNGHNPPSQDLELYEHQGPIWEDITSDPNLNSNNKFQKVQRPMCGKKERGRGGAGREDKEKAAGSLRSA